MATFNIGATSDMKADLLAKWITHRITGDIQEVPFVGPAYERAFAEAGVNNTFQLLGKMLTMKENSMNSQDWCNEFFQWLGQVGVNAHRAKLTLVVAEKCSVSFPGIFNRAELDDTA